MTGGAVLVQLLHWCDAVLTWWFWGYLRVANMSIAG